MVEHWIGEHEEKLRNKAERFNFDINMPETDSGPIELEYSDGSEVSLVDTSDTTGTFGVEYTPGDKVNPAVKLNRSSYRVGDYHHESWGTKDGAVDWVVNIMKQHDTKN